MSASLVGSEMCIRDSSSLQRERRQRLIAQLDALEASCGPLLQPCGPVTSAPLNALYRGGAGHPGSETQEA
eukprot:1554770-Alexandrium_andersonii.AAC.1